MLIRLNAGNDTNGNPRRVYVRFDASGHVKDAYDEGYQGPGAVPKTWRHQAALCATFDTSPREYRALVRQYAHNRKA